MQLQNEAKQSILCSHLANG